MGCGYGDKTTWNDGSSVYGVAFSPDGKSVVSGDDNGEVVLWDVATGARRTWNDGSTVKGVAFSPDGKTVATGDVSGQVSLWDVAAGTKITTWDDGTVVQSVAFSPDGGTLATADTNGQVALNSSIIWRASYPVLEKRLCSELGGWNMTPAQWATYIPSQPYGATCP